MRNQIKRPYTVMYIQYEKPDKSGIWKCNIRDYIKQLNPSKLLGY